MKHASHNILIAAFILVKLILHFTTFANYELHRDALLYYSLGEHLAWGYVSVPPFIAVIGRFSTFLFGNTTFALRFFPAIAGGLSIFIISRIVKELKGGRIAQILALSAFLLSPAFLRSNSLFQPVTFNQFFWLLSAYLVIRLVNRNVTQLWIYVFLVWGVGVLNKYSIAFFIGSCLLAILLTEKRKLMWNKHFLLGGILGILIILPNILWQHTNNWPLLHHMHALQENQFVHVTWQGFLIDQLLMNLPGLLVWIAGIFILLPSGYRKFRFVGIQFFFLVGIILLLHGKSYYTLGIYSILFAMGGVILEKHLSKITNHVILGMIILLSVVLMPFSLPILKPDKLAEYSKRTAPFTNRWEDGKIYKIPQDFADMNGWKELSEQVTTFYHSLSPRERAETIIFAENYGQAGALTFYGKNEGLPSPISFSDNFLLWAPDSISTNSILYINDNPGEIPDYFDTCRCVSTIDNMYFRENGLSVYYCSEPDPSFFKIYANKTRELKNSYTKPYIR